MIHRMFWLFLGLVLALPACGPVTSTSAISAAEPTSRRAYWESIAPSCGGYPSKADCNDGDMVLFGGLLCASGDPRGCALVRDSQDGDGRFWRSPRRNPDNAGENNSFSRDMALGVMLYLVKTNDGGAAEAWMDWINSHRPCVQRKPNGDCLIRGPHRFCTDDSDQRCTISPANWGNLGRVWQSLGLGRTSEMRAYEDADGDALWQKAENVDPGYELHLAGVETLLKIKLDQSRAPRERAARALASRQGDNPFYLWLRDGTSADVDQKLHDYCPSASAPTAGGRHQWSWERDTAERAWQDTSGWDCLFLANLAGFRAGGD